MANVQAGIDFIVKGGSKLERLIERAGQLEGIVNKINAQPINLGLTAATNAFDTADTNLKTVREQIKNAQKDYNEFAKQAKASISGYEKELDASAKSLSKLTIGSKEYKNALGNQLDLINKIAKAEKEREEARERLTKAERQLPGALREEAETKAVKERIQLINSLADEYLKFGKFQTRTPVTGAIAKDQKSPGTVAQLRAQADTLQLIANNSEIASREFNRFSLATEVASQRIFDARQKQLKAVAEGLTQPGKEDALRIGKSIGSKEDLEGARKVIGNFVESYGAITKSEAAMGAFVGRARELQSIVPYLSDEWQLLEGVINNVNGEMQQLEQRVAGLRGQSSNLAKAVKDGIAKPSGPSSLLPSYDITSSTKKADYYAKLEKARADQQDKLLSAESAINKLRLDQVEAAQLRNQVDLISEKITDGQIDKAKQLKVELNRQIKQIQDRTKAEEIGIATRLGGAEQLREQTKYYKTENKTEKPFATLLGGGAEVKARNRAEKEAQKLVENTRIAEQKLEGARNRIFTALEGNTITKLQSNKLLDQLNDAGLAIDQKRLTVARAITAEVDRQRVAYAQANRSKEGGVYKTGEFSPINAKNRIENAITSAKTVEAGLLKLEKEGVDVSEELLRVKNAIAFAENDNYKNSQKSLNALIDANAAAGKRLALEKALAVPKVVGQAVRSDIRSSIDAPKRAAGLSRSAGIVEAQLQKLEEKNVDTSEERARVQSVVNSLRQNELNLSNKLLENLNEELNISRDFIKLQRASGSGGSSSNGKKSKQYEPALSSQEVREKISKIVTDFNAAVGKTEAPAGDIADNASSSLAKGLRDGVSRVSAASINLGNSIWKGIKKALKMASPSRVMIEITKNLVDTLISELQKQYPRIDAATKRAFGLEDLKGNVRQLKATNKGFEETYRPSTGYRPLETGESIKNASDELNDTFNRFKREIAALTTQPKIYENLLNALPNSRLNTDLVDAANRRALAVENLPSFLPTQRAIGPGELENTITKQVAEYLREVRVPNPWTAIIGDFDDLIKEAARVSESIKGSAESLGSIKISDPWIKIANSYQSSISRIVLSTESLQKATRNLALPGTRIAGALPAVAQAASSARQQRIDAAYERSAQRAQSVLAQDALRNTGRPELSAVDFGFMADPARIARLSGIGRALPPAIDVSASSVNEESRTLRQTISELFDRLNSAVRNAFGGANRPPIPPVPPIPPAGGGGSGGGAGGGAGDVNLQRFLDLGDLAPLARATNQQLEVLEANLVNVRNGLARTDPAFDRITNRLQQLGREQERRAPNATPLTRKFGPRTANAISEGLIGGAFPLLFGQGLGASAFGLAGGAAGGFAGGGLGFGLSLIGTALGTAFDQLSQAAQDTGKALRYPIEGFEKLKEAGLFASKQQEFYIQKLIDSGKATEAAALIQKQIASKIGPQGVNDLNRLGKASDELSKAWADLYLEIQAGLAGPLAGLLEWVKSIVKASTGGIQKQAFALDPEAFRAAEEKAKNKATSGNFFAGLLPRYNKNYTQELDRLSAEIIAKNAAKLPEIKPAEFTPDQIESSRQKAQQAADEIKQAYRSAFQLQRQGIDLEIQAADNRRKVENDIFAKRQEAARTEADNARTAAQVRIESTDLALRKSFSGAEGEARTILGAVREYIKVRATGEADINKKRRDLEVTMAGIQQETSNYIFEQAKTRLQLERSIEDYKRQVSDYQLENQRKIQQLQNVEMAGGAAGGLGAAVQRIGGAWQFRGTSLQKNMQKGDYLSDPRENFFFDFRKDLIPAAQARIKTLSKKDIAALAFTVLTEAGPTDIGKLDVAANLVTRSAGMGNAPISQVAKQPGQYAGVFPYTRAQLESTAEGKRLFGKEYDRVAKLIAGQASDVQMSPIYSRGPTAAQAGNVKEGSRVGYAQPAYQYQQAASQLAPVSPSLDVNTPGMVAAQEKLKQLAQDRLKIEQQLSNLGIDAALLGITEAARGESNIIALENELKLEKNRYQAILENSGASANEVAIINQKLAGQAKLSLTKDYELQALQLINDATEKGLITQDESKKLTDAIKEGIKDRLLFLKQEIGLEEEKLRVQQQQESAQRLANVEREIALADIGLKFGYIGEAARAFRQELDISGSVAQAQQFADAVQRLETLPGRQIAAEYDTAATSLQKLATWENVAVTGVKSISEGFGQAFREIAAGTASAQEILAGFFQNLANSFADMAAQMISNMLQMLIYKQLLGPMFGFNPGGGFGAGLGSAAFGGGLASGSSWGGFAGALAMPLLGGAGFFADGGMFADGIKPYADGGMFADGIKPFADGGIVDSPTLFKFADGGALSNGVMGEAGPEAIMPLSRGSDGRLGVEGGGGDVNVTVNVDASGSKVQGDDQKSSQLGRALAAAVREELLKQKRPGGLLQ